MTPGDLVTYFFKGPLSVLFILVTEFWYFDLHDTIWPYMTRFLAIYYCYFLLFGRSWATITQ